MAKAKTKGAGWFKQSVRHSNARKYGKAGGQYKERIGSFIKKNPNYKNLTFKQLKNKGLFLKYNRDADGDGVKNIKDCRPLNPKAQDNGYEVSYGDTTIGGAGQVASTGIGVLDKGIGVVEQGVGTVKETVKGVGNIVSEGEKQLGGVVQKGEELAIEKEKTKRAELESQKEAEELEKKKFEEEEKPVSNTRFVEQETFLDDITRKVKEAHNEKEALRERREEKRRDTVEKIIGKKILNEDEIDVRSLTDHELKRLSVLKGKGFFDFFDNDYEAELKRRKEEEIRLKTDLEITADRANEKRAERIYKERLLDSVELKDAKKRIKEEVEGGGFFGL